MTYAVVNCPRCKKLVVASLRYKSRTCPYCGARIPLKGQYVTFKTAKDARLFKAKLQGLLK